ncbi:MAG: Methylated-DNA/protein-cysteine methyltransferase [Candidatus Magasanikbacteria bacterium GW2011_GWA2_50_22]|uniref:methylated-DNA--[protein]-cysteine S-methyltransferase n=1 Tax=Candidatus Magasanikbacteria bacterium GW2011_GWA2_50_22 TaxID=1619043 RepID=A0A0G1WF23_9BACT|nr:MAG: Methylated-DNA/protein-cysteine methyltransferase [Candidatus Magasanikbacteria bacterium GW2011_GWA2_50_22]
MDFAKIVLEHVSKIPCGKVLTYKELASATGRPRAYRAVGNALHHNPRPLEVPCHRVIKSDGRVGGYIYGSKKKIGLLRQEGIKIEHGRIRNFTK